MMNREVARLFLLDETFCAGRPYRTVISPGPTGLRGALYSLGPWGWEEVPIRTLVDRVRGWAGAGNQEWIRQRALDVAAEVPNVLMGH